MGLLQLLASGGSQSYVPDPPPAGGGVSLLAGTGLVAVYGSVSDNPLAADPNAPPPYTIPTAAPYNSPQALATPTYEGSGQAIHPKVLDFGAGGWNGWRYWMVHSPFPGNDDRHENPSILVSQNGYYWQTPTGVPNPLYPAPPVPGFNSDPHLAYDPTANQLVVLYRTTLDRVNHTMYVARSGNGVTWPASPTAISVSYGSDSQLISPALVRVAEGDWRLFGLSYASKALNMYKASAPEGPWSGPFLTVGIGVSGPTWNWHLDVHLVDNVFRLLMDRGPVHEGRPDYYYGGSSSDGMSWAPGLDQFMTKGDPGDWDDGELYRACLLPDSGGTKYRIWYSAHDEATTQTWGIGYTEVPRSLWPSAPVVTSGSGTAYQTLALSHGSSMMWRMGIDPLTTNTVPDATGNGRTGTFVGRYARSAPMTGEAGFATRVDQGYLYREYEAWMAASSFTIRAVVRPESTYATKSIVSLRGANGGWELRAVNTYLQFVHLESGTTVSGGSINANTSYHLAVTVSSGGEVIIYRNGTQVGAGTIPTSYNFTGARLSVGGSWTGTDWAGYWTGHHEYVDFVPSVLTPAQVAASAAEAL